MQLEQPTLFDTAPLVMGDWESIAKAYQRELEPLRPIVDAIHKHAGLYCVVCWGKMSPLGKHTMDGWDKMSGHKEDCPYYLWLKAREK